MYREMAESCMREIYRRMPPSDEYIQRGVNLLLGTAATESGFEYRRQMGFDTISDKGAWGLWQTESAPLADGLRYLARRPGMARRAAQWLYGRTDAIWPYMGAWNMSAILRQLYNDDRLACLMARIHYMRFPAPIPATASAQAAYYKKYYNTVAGSGSVEKYLEDFDTYAAPLMT